MKVCQPLTEVRVLSASVRRNCTLLLLLAIVVPGMAFDASGRQPPKPSPAPCAIPVDVPLGGTNDSIEGPACVRVRFNALRYRAAKLGESVRRDGAVDVSGLFPMPKVAVSKALPPGSTAKSMESRFLELRAARHAERATLEEQLRQVRSLDASSTSQFEEIKQTILASEDLLGRAAGPDDLKPLFAPGGAVNTTKANMAQLLAKSAWPDFDDQLQSVLALEREVGDFQFQRFPTPPQGDTGNFSDFSKNAVNSAGYNDLKSDLQALETAVRAELIGSAPFQAMQKKLFTLRFWSVEWAPLDERSFFLQRYVTGGVLFNTAKHKTEQLSVVDRLPTLQQQELPESKVTDMITVDFANPISLTAGVAFSSVGEREFAIVDSVGPASGGAPTSVKRFGTVNHSSIHPLPLGIVHARLWESPGHITGLHASFGIAGNFQPDAAGGSGADFLVGPSLSLFRFAYITLGYHLGRTAKLSGGFKEGDVVPSGVTTVPIQKSYQSGVGVAMSFTRP